MISFRYHLISVIAIFLAIALGVVVGTTALNGAVVGDLRRQVSDLKDTNAQSQAANKALQAKAGNADELANAYGSKILGGALAKKSVVLLAAPGVSASLLDGIGAELTAAGGTVSARLQLTKSFLDPQRASDIRSLATTTQPIGLDYPTTDDVGTLAGSLLGFVLLGKGAATDLSQVLSGFGQLGMIQASGSNPAAGQAVVLVSSATMAKDDPAAMMLVSLAGAIGSAGPTVVADAGGGVADAGGLVSLLRGDADAGKSVATVDDAGDTLGQLTVALTVADSLKGHHGDYGAGAGADALLPGAAG